MWKRLRASAMRNSKAMNVEPPKTLVEDERNPPTRVPEETDSLDSDADLSAIGNLDLNRNGGYRDGSDGEYEAGQDGRQLGHQSNGEISVTEYEDAPLHDGSHVDYSEPVSRRSGVAVGKSAVRS